jgi:hypothetical protein
VLLAEVGAEGGGGVVLDEDLDDEGPVGVAAADGLEEAGLADAAGGERAGTGDGARTSFRRRGRALRRGRRGRLRGSSATGRGPSCGVRMLTLP